MPKSPLLISRFVVGGFFAIVCLLLWERPATAQKAMADPPTSHGNNPLCPGSAVPCLLFDDFAAHVVAQLQVSPGTAHRDTAVRFPFGFAVHLAGQLAATVFTSYSFWNQSGTLNHQFGPLELGLAARVWPMHPRLRLEGATDHDAEPPAPSGLQLGLSFQQELRLSGLSGPNSLGILSDLAALRAVASRRLWILDVTASIGALYDWQGAFVVGEGAFRVALRLPFFEQLEVFGEAMTRGVVYQNDQKLATLLTSEAMPSLDPAMAFRTLASGGALGPGFAFHVHRRVDFGITVHAGYGGVARWNILANAAALSFGDPYKDHPATSVAEMAFDATKETAVIIMKWIEERSIDPFLDHRCMLLDDNGDPMMDQPAGVRSADGKYCLVQGEMLPIGENWWRDKKKSVICRDEKRTDCLMYRRPDAKTFRVLHRPWVGDDCVLRENVYDPTIPGPTQTRIAELAVLGTKTKDQTGCVDTAGRVHTIGTQYYREHDHTFICAAPRIEEQRDRCFLALAELPQNIKNQATKLGRIARAMDQGMTGKAESIDKIPGRVAQTAEDFDEGRITLDAVKHALYVKAKDIAKHTNLKDAEQWLKGKLDKLEEWAKKPGIEQGEDVAREAGDSMIPNPVTVGATVVTGGVSRGTFVVVEEAGEVGEVGAGLAQAGKRVAEGAGVAEHTVPAAVQTEKKVVLEGMEQRLAKKIRSLQRQRDEHIAKLAAYKKNPEAFDNLGYLRNAPSDEVRAQIINARIRHLEHEIANFEKQIAEAKRGVE